jgi:hypothetical protein
MMYAICIDNRIYLKYIHLNMYVYIHIYSYVTLYCAPLKKPKMKLLLEKVIMIHRNEFLCIWIVVSEYVYRGIKKWMYDLRIKQVDTLITGSSNDT